MACNMVHKHFICGLVYSFSFADQMPAQLAGYCRPMSFVAGGSAHGPECSATGMGQFPICKLKWDLLMTSVTACTIDKNTFSAPFGIFYVRMEI